jgi:outer membrane lipoprotein-sorting protein
MRSVVRALALVGAGAFFLSAAASAQTADEIVARHLKARGADKWRQIQTMKVTAVITRQGGPATHLTTISKRPNLVRQEATDNGQTFVQAYDGTTAWGIIPPFAPEARALDPQAAKTLADQADFDTVLMDYKAKGHTVELIGKEKIGDRDAYHLKVTRKNGVVQHYYIDAETWLEARITTNIGPAGKDLKFVSEPSQFRDVEGVMMPFHITQGIAGMPKVDISIDKIEFNVPVDDSVFGMPKKPSLAR